MLPRPSFNSSHLAICAVLSPTRTLRPNPLPIPRVQWSCPCPRHTLRHRKVHNPRTHFEKHPRSPLQTPPTAHASSSSRLPSTFASSPASPSAPATNGMVNLSMTPEHAAQVQAILNAQAQANQPQGLPPIQPVQMQHAPPTGEAPKEWMNRNRPVAVSKTWSVTSQLFTPHHTISSFHDLTLCHRHCPSQ
jgi:hypothetical protein